MTDNKEQSVSKSRADRLHWRYMSTGRVTHALTDPSHTIAWCGASTWWASHWLGTGTQSEYERAAALPRCRNCLRRTES